MSNLSNIPGGGDLPDRYRNVGEQIQAFFDFAENNPDRAVPIFANIWETQGSLTTRALALQGLGRAAQHGHVKQALADWDVLKDIAKEVKGKGEVSSDLTRWAAAKALEDIGYSLRDLQHLEGGGFTEPLDRIRREIRDRKLAEINRIPRLNTRGETTAEYDRNREFWLYGPVEELFAGNDSSWNYQELVGDVVHDLHGRGVYLGLRSSNRIVHGAALREAELIFKESAEIEEFIYELLEKFLSNSNHEVSLRITAAKIIHTATDLSKKLKTLSKLLSQEKDAKLLEVVLHHAQSFFMESVDNQKFLYGYLEQFLIDRTHEVSVRIMAIEIITKASGLKKVETLSKLLLEDVPLQNVALRQIRLIFKESSQIEELLFETLDQFLNYNYEVSLKVDAAELVYTARNLNKKLTSLSKLLLEDTELRNVGVRLLTPYKQELAKVDADAYTVLETLNFEYTIDKPEPKDLTIAEMENRISSANQLKSQISTRFVSAIASAESLASQYRRSNSVLKQFLQNKQDEYLSNADIWIEVLRNQISQTAVEQRKVQSNQSLLKETINLISNLESWEARKVISYRKEVQISDENFLLHSTDLTFNHSLTLKKDLNSLKFYLINLLSKTQSEFKKSLNNGLFSGSESIGLKLFLAFLLFIYIDICFAGMSLWSLIGGDNIMSTREKIQAIAIGLFNIVVIIITVANYQFILDNYGQLSFVVILMMAMGIRYFITVIDDQIVAEQLKKAESISNNLYNQWKS
jgi:hypothetical protein